MFRGVIRVIVLLSRHIRDRAETGRLQTDKLFVHVFSTSSRLTYILAYRMPKCETRSLDQPVRPCLSVVVSISVASSLELHIALQNDKASETCANMEDGWKSLRRSFLECINLA